MFFYFLFFFYRVSTAMGEYMDSVLAHASAESVAKFQL